MPPFAGPLRPQKELKDRGRCIGFDVACVQVALLYDQRASMRASSRDVVLLLAFCVDDRVVTRSLSSVMFVTSMERLCRARQVNRTTTLPLPHLFFSKDVFPTTRDVPSLTTSSTRLGVGLQMTRSQATHASCIGI